MVAFGFNAIAVVTVPKADQTVTFLITQRGFIFKFKQI